MQIRAHSFNRPSIGGIPTFEPGLEEMVRENVAEQQLRFTTSIEEGVDESDVVFIAVPTPPQSDGMVR